jgi:hypothetical protein
MRLSRWSLLVFIVGILTPLVWAGTKEDLADFRSLLADQREHLVKFAAEWQELDPEVRGRLGKVLMRYTDWLARLPEAERKSIAAAPSTQKKVELIRKLREKQWLGRQPKADRDKVENAKNEADRQKQLADLREKERRREMNWQFFLIRGEDQQVFTQQMGKLHEDVAAKIRGEDRPKLANARKEGWPLYPKTLLELAQKYSVPVPPLVQSRITLLTVPHVNLDKLMDFAATIENVTIRDDFEARIKGNDPAKRDEAILELTGLYWKMHPYELKKAREEEDRRRQQKKTMGK